MLEIKAESEKSFFKIYSLELAILVAAVLVSSSVFVAFGNIAASNQALITQLRAAQPAGATGSANVVAAPSAPTEISFGTINVDPLAINSRPLKGAQDAGVTILEFSDFQCPFCQRAHPQVQTMLADQSGKVNYAYRHFNAANHPLADKAGEAYECAVAQGKGWEYMDKLFEKTPALEIADLKQYAIDVQLDSAIFDSCLDSGEKSGVYQSDNALAQQYGARGTPAFMVIGGNVDRIDQAPLLEFKQALEEADVPVGFYKTSDNKVVVTFSGALPYQYYQPVLNAVVQSA